MAAAPAAASDKAPNQEGISLKFATFSSEIELPFYSALFSSKLEHDKLSDSARPVLGLYEPRPSLAADDSVKMQVLGSALTSHQ
jgi:ubiquitin-like modifier-activating enzyme ATG7